MSGSSTPLNSTGIADLEVRTVDEIVSFAGGLDAFDSAGSAIAPSVSDGGAQQDAAVPMSFAAADTGVSDPQSTAGYNRIVLENMLPGTPQSVWDLTQGASSEIEGFTTDISYDLGQTVSFKINTSASDYRIEIYRLGYYGGDGARLMGVIDPAAGDAVAQAAPLYDPATGLVDAGNWVVTDTWTVPEDAVSGIYIAKLVREDGTFGENHVPFIVRDDTSTSDIVFQTSDSTWQAYNGWGGANLYGGNGPGGDSSPGRAYAVSYNRPITTRESGGWASGPQDFIFSVEYPALRWLEMNGYDVSYISGVDTARFGENLLNHKVFLSVGHDEYWSGEQRANVEAARDAGVSLAFLSGNAMYWKTRWEASIDGSETDYRTMVTYKETRAGGKIDPSGEWTGTWRDPTYDPSLGGQSPENALQGTMFQVDSYRLDTIEIPYDMTQLRFWRNTAVAETTAGETAALVANLLGYEWDIAPDNAFTPDGLIKLSSTTLAVDTLLYDYGTEVGPGIATHNLTLYRAESGALVFGAGTVYWSWGLDSNHDLEATPTDASVQQAMVNLFADMGVQPQTLQAGLAPATASIDFIAPTSTMNSVGGAVLEGQRVELTGHMADIDGKVASVEVSTDGGSSWWMADFDSGAGTWSYTWTAPAAGTYQLMARSIDDSLNMGYSSAPQAVTVTEASQVSLFSLADTPPPLPQDWDPSQVTLCCNVCVVHVFGPAEVGVKFAADRSGTISSIRFYKDERNTGEHVAHLWAADGTLLATAVFTAETGSGWQQVQLSQPVAIAANTVYIASYSTTEGIYLASHGTYFAEAHTSGPLTALASDWQTGPNGVIGDAGAFPGGPVQSSMNYWVDVVFDPSSTVGNTGPVAAGDTGFATDRDNVLALGADLLLANDTDANGDPLAILGVSGATHGAVAWDYYRRVVTFTPEAGYVGDASFTYTVTDGRGGTSEATVTVAVEEPPYRVSLFGEGDTPQFAQTVDPNPIEVGVRFTAATDGSITGIRFYKGSLNTGTHTANLWSSDGTLLATATFANESASGWQQVLFAAPVTLAAGQTYVASYHTTSGMYASTPGYFATTHVSGPLSAEGGANGVFAYGPAGSFPNGSYNNTNYWVDVLFEPGAADNATPVANADGVFAVTRGTPLVLHAAALLANDTDANFDTLVITGVAGAVNGSVSWDAVAGTITFTPDADYTGSASFSYAISDGRGGVAEAVVSLSVQPPGTHLSLFDAGSVPQTASVQDTGSIELGLRFSVAENGSISGIRFYKGALNTGTHVAKLYSADGTLLASATFVNETASGWQQVSFSEPVTITAGQSYVASYYTSSGYYSATSGFFEASYTANGITAEAGNGLYHYGAGGGFPTQSYGATNYWVDVMFESGSGGAALAQDDGDLFASPGTPLVIPLAYLLRNDAAGLSVTGIGAVAGGTAVLDAQAGTITFTADPGGDGLASFDYTVAGPNGATGSATAGIAVVPAGSHETLFGLGEVPTTAAAADSDPVQLGLRFTADVGGLVTGIRFYKGALNTGTHTGQLWSADGTLLASAVFTEETESGWQQVSFSEPVSIAAGQSYVASYHTTSGHYAVTGGYFAAEVENGVLNATGGGNGVYAYGAAGSFPTLSWDNSNYWVDVVMDARNRAPTATADTGLVALADTPRVIGVANLLANDSDADGDVLTITGVTGATYGTAVFDAQAGTITFTADPGHTGAAGFTYTVADGRGGVAEADVSLTIQSAGVSLFAAADTPATASVNDPGGISLGMRFESTMDGAVTGVRFYKGELNTGTHTGSVWTAEGTLLGSVTFTGESESGWQQADFATPIAITAGTDYVVSYHTSSGYYSATPQGFAETLSNGPLAAPSSAESGGNGLYGYGPAPAFPASSYNSTNYFVDVVFQPQLAA